MIRAGQAAGSKIIRRMRWVTKAINTHRICNTYSFVFPHGHSGCTNAPRRHITYIGCLTRFCQYPSVHHMSCCVCRPVDGRRCSRYQRAPASVWKGAHDCEVGAVTRLLAVRSRGQGFELRQVQDFFSLHQTCRPAVRLALPPVRCAPAMFTAGIAAGACS